MGKIYTDEKNAQIVLALLKAHGIRRIVANPGTTNIAIVGSAQNDPWFEVYSGVDERHSAYMAVGMAVESGEPVVLSCTGATASRNYYSALTEAYYRKIPILALTSIHHMNSAGNLLPQMIDRTVQPKDIVRYSIQCPVPYTAQQENDCILNVNKALLELTRHGGGPVHINLETERVSTFNTERLPEVDVIRRVTLVNPDWPKIPLSSKVALWIGAHRKFRKDEIEAIENFVQHNNAVVFTDCTSGYMGLQSISASLVGCQQGAGANPEFQCLKPDITIQIGEVSGDYESFGFAGAAKEIWRVSEDGEARDLFNKLSVVFEMDEKTFFDHYSQGEGEKTFYEGWSKSDKAIRENWPTLPFSNIWIAEQLNGRIPRGSQLHLGILNSLRSWDFLGNSVSTEAFSNVGGFGIDGGLSTLIGASLVNQSRLYFGVFGDLSFFYDLNSLGNRHIGKNVRILLVNNGCGAEFNLYSHYGSQFGERTNDYIAAGRHFGNKSPTLVRHYAEDLGFTYISANSQEEFVHGVDDFVSLNQPRSVIFECFTNAKDESDALYAIKHIKPYQHGSAAGVRRVVSSLMPERVKRAIKELVR